MNTTHTTEATPTGDTRPVAAEPAATARPVRQEEQGQQSQQDVASAAVDYGCWYHEDAVKAAGKSDERTGR